MLDTCAGCSDPVRSTEFDCDISIGGNNMSTRYTRFRLTGLCLFAAMTALATGAQPARAQTPSGVVGGQLRLAIQAEPKTFGPLLAADEPSQLVRDITGATLLRLNRQTQ